MSLAASVDTLLSYLSNQKKASPLTIRNYRHYLCRFLAFCRTISPPLSTVGQITPEILSAYEQFLMEVVDKDNIPLKRITKQYHLIALRTWLRYLKIQGVKAPAYTSIKLMPVVRAIGVTAKESTIHRLIAAVPTTGLQGLRDRAILELFLATGIKVSELVGLNRNDILLASRQMVLANPRSVTRHLGFSERAGICLERYIATRLDVFPALFIRYSGRLQALNDLHRSQRLSARSVQRMLKLYGKKVGIVAPTPEGLRRTFGERMRRNAQG